jgi:succinyl-diaminopimelate desuccinylase
VAARHGATTRAVISGEAFLTPPGDFSALVVDAIRAETGLEAEISTSGGTSDARFLKSLCPVIEFGLCNATMHKRDEAVAIADLEALERIFARVVVAGLKQV